MNHNFSSGCC